ncbi:CoxG family protein [Roseibium limicola]|uniref:Carbon monoxide dehydrogenase subunit G n=1 Tax=Roseibium limicola TaxID=2816037 RepID=A0A939EM86_9HYPH|nr:carbon monoxide dehydrogenase subunit G [Roseibium limicola]MBO0345295.1 carbon monoxide dehydrogenase subunit G [Roseibium limicola]
MKMADSQKIEAPRETVWAALNDPQVLKQCIPGCEELEMTDGNQMQAKVKLKVGPVKATFGGKVTLEDLNPPESYRIVGEGSGGVAGFAKGGAVVRLEEDGPDATILHYDVDAQVGGKIAQLGGRLIDSTAKRLAGEFFKTFGEVVAPSSENTEAAESTDGAEEPAKKGWLSGVFSKKDEKPADTDA